MIINFDQLEEKVVPNFKGGEKSFAVKTFQNNLGKIMHGRLIPGATIGWHIHETSSEIIYILKGVATVKTDQGMETALPGQVTYCPKGEGHSMRNEGTEDLEFLAIVAEQ